MPNCLANRAPKLISDGHVEELAAIQFIEAAVALPNESSQKEHVSFCKTRFFRLQLKSGDHSPLVHSGTDMRATFPEASRCCIRALQAEDNGRLLCERDQDHHSADYLLECRIDMRSRMLFRRRLRSAA